MAANASSRYHLIQKLMRRCWRVGEPAPDVSPGEIKAMLPVITSTGSAPLIWSRLRSLPDIAKSGAGLALQERYRAAILFAAVQGAAIEQIMAILAPAGIVPIQFKGWSVAQYYAVPDLRPSGDIDMCAPPGRFEEMARLLAPHGLLLPGTDGKFDEQEIGLSMDLGLPDQVTKIDLHRDLNRYLHRSQEDVYARSQLVPVVDTHIRILAPEDHLRLLCLHFLGHGGWRPIWLCDIGAMVENLPDNFDWEFCFGEDPLRRHWIVTAINLAHALLDADLQKLPQRYHTALPQWLVPAVVKQWNRPFDSHMPKPLFSYVLRHTPLRIVQEFAARWPDPITATYHRSARFDAKPRWPCQTAFFFKAAISFLREPKRD